MKYRKYGSMIKAGSLVLTAITLAACASSTAVTTESAGREISSVNEKEAKAEEANRFDGREPSSLKGDFSWLNDVEDDFGRIADETSTRAVASQNKQNTLMKQKDWSFYFLSKTNRFYVEVQGIPYKMVQTKINDGERFAFAAEGQAENPLTFSVSSGEGRETASESAEETSCDTEVSYWNKLTKAYVTDRVPVKGKACDRMLSLLKDYVP